MKTAQECDNVTLFHFIEETHPISLPNFEI
jgi:hypothetical protein